MKKSWKLELVEGIYCEKCQRERRGGELVDWHRKAICGGFVRLILMEHGDLPEKIRMVVTDEKQDIYEGSVGEGWIEIEARRQGFYRWWWEFKSQPQYYFGTIYGIHGIYQGCEEALTGMFPLEFEEREQSAKRAKTVLFLQERGGGEESYRLWVQVERL